MPPGYQPAARKALVGLQRRSEAILVHFDVDVMDFPAVDVPHPQGLDAGSAFSALEVFAAAPTCAAGLVEALYLTDRLSGSTRPVEERFRAALEALVGAFSETAVEPQSVSSRQQETGGRRSWLPATLASVPEA